VGFSDTRGPIKKKRIDTNPLRQRYTFYRFGDLLEKQKIQSPSNKLSLCFNQISAKYFRNEMIAGNEKSLCFGAASFYP